ncbi:alkylated DNA repair protein alkB homolog 8 [Toxorhynchites rutilus septentrionalis]|uniref:alkylated DNA repair protein alkB homolog 8 n=1 Tax=Toxorhynchites rutilus septentrionalis TaxID=329112 RepID=UPI002479394B|nr:alkylated DNA repair protein alkB homolog 8 [Toxorhynchites rutilus septentrionalis]
MNISKNAERKIQRKIKRCQVLIAKETKLQFSEVPTENVVICNAGLSTGLQQEVLLEEVLRHAHSLENVFFPPGKSYCYLRFESAEIARTVCERMNGVAPLGQDGCVLLMSYCISLPEKGNNTFGGRTPPGLILVPDFVNEKLESALQDLVDWEEDMEIGSNLKHRRVKHYGYEFLYGTNNVDRNKPLDRKIPSICESMWEKLRHMYPTLDWHVPDQLTVNYYEPGQGIPPHVDTHSVFKDPIISLSLGSDVIMDFRDVKGNHLNVDLPRRSLLIMTGESRYGWTHGITPRKMDTVRCNNSLTIRKRKIRVSFTFRKLQDGPCHCQFSSLCDTHQRDTEHRKDLLKENAAQVELENVHNVYNHIAKHFNKTRHSPWPRVEAFLKSLEPGCILLDVGCGNGKYLGLNSSIVNLGCDRSDGLLKVCTDRGFSVVQCDCLALPFRSASVDACISIAVIHHLATETRRMQAVAEMARVLRPGGRALVYVWAKNQEADEKKSSYLRQNKQNNKPRKGNKIEKDTTEMDGETILPIHTNRTQFQHQDLLVPWKLRNVECSEAGPKVTFLRYYHVFNEHELQEMCGKIGEILVEDSYYDQGNWCVVFKKIA